MSGKKVRLRSISTSQVAKGRNAGRWVATARVIIDGESQRIGRTAFTEADAVEKVHQYLDELRNPTPEPEPEPTPGDAEPQPTPAPPPTFSEVATRWAEVTLPTLGKAPSTVALYTATANTDLIPALGQTPVTDITASDIEALLVAKAHLSPSTRRRIITVARFILDTAIRDGHADTNPAKAVTRPAERPADPKAHTADELSAILAAAQDERLGSLVHFLAWTGVRIGEVLALRDADITLDGPNPEARIRGTLTRVKGEGLVMSSGKSRNARRVIPLTPEAVEALRTWKATRATDKLSAGPFWNDTGYLFTTEAGKPLCNHNVRRVYYRIAERAGVKSSPHRLRHTAATDMLSVGVSLRQAQEILGHASPVTTARIYQTVTDAHRREAVEALRRARSTA